MLVTGVLMQYIILIILETLQNTLHIVQNNYIFFVKPNLIKKLYKKDSLKINY